MPIFTYQGTDGATRALGGTIVADSPREARERLRGQGLWIENLSPQRQPQCSGWSFWHRPGRHASTVTMAIRDLATLVGTGIGLVDALDTLIAQHRGRFREALQRLRERVAGGSGLSEAMRSEPAYFDELCLQMVRVGENAGTLDAVLDKLADFRERSLQFKDRITTALVYPVIVVTLAMGVSIFLMTVVLPMLLENLIAAGRPLPWPTRVLKTVSDTLLHHGWWLVGTGLLVFLGLTLLARTRSGNRLWHRLLFALPLLGPLARKQEIARAAVVISTLMENGIVFVEAVKTAGRAARNALLKEALETLENRVQSGGDIGEALSLSGVFPPLVVQIFTVGQQTGELERMLARLADGYERQVASATTRFTAALEPLLIVVLALLVGFILFATILPILEAGNVL